MTLDEAVNAATNRAFKLIEFDYMLMLTITRSVVKSTDTRIFRVTFIAICDVIDPTLRFCIQEHIEASSDIR